MKYRAKKSSTMTGGSTLHRSDRYTIQSLGFALTVVGVLLFVISFYNPTPTPIALVVVGIILLIIARDMKPKQETDATIADH